MGERSYRTHDGDDISQVIRGRNLNLLNVRRVCITIWLPVLVTTSSTMTLLVTCAKISVRIANPYCCLDATSSLVLFPVRQYEKKAEPHGHSQVWATSRIQTTQRTRWCLSLAKFEEHDCVGLCDLLGWWFLEESLFLISSVIRRSGQDLLS